MSSSRDIRVEDVDKSRDRSASQRGGGAYNKSSRRYWESDDYYKRGGRDYDRGRGRRSRSRSRGRRSYSRSRSRSRTRSRSRGRDRGRSPRKAEDLKARPPTTGKLPPAPAPPSIQLPQLYDPATGYAPDTSGTGGWESIANPPSHQSQQAKPTSVNGQSKQQQFYPGSDLGYQYPNQKQDLELVANRGGPSSGPGNNYNPFPTAKPQPGYVPAPVGSSARTTEESSENSAKITKKDGKKKKRRKSSSSSSSSSSSGDSSDSHSKRRSKRRESKSSSDSSSEDEKKKEKPKAMTAAGVTGGLTPAQKKALEKQLDGYKVKLEIFEREIRRLVAKEDELASSNADMKLIEENLRLQLELKSRCKAVNVVLQKIKDVLNGGTITAEGKPRPAPPPPPKLSMLPEPIPAAPPVIQQVTLVPTSAILTKPKIEACSAFDFYDNGNHWCRLCNVFPQSLKQLLDHFHTKEHHLQNEQLGIEEKPWHKIIPLKETKPEHGAKKVPFRGMQFFTPVQGWYCRLCNEWMGDIDMATHHLKSEDHHSNFTNFLTEHPGWETKYLKDTERARMLAGYGPAGAPAEKPSGGPAKYNLAPVCLDLEPEEDKGRSIRVQMRNKAKEEENRAATQASILMASNINAPPVGNSKDKTSVDEWMQKPQKVALDIIDTQKFAAIVRQRHGAKEKEKEEKKVEVPLPAPPVIRLDRENDVKSRHPDPKKGSDLRVELSLGSGRGRDRLGRDNARDRDRRRSRTRSRSRSRERGGRDREKDRYGSRRRASRSRERERERSREERKPEVKENVRKLPIIGKMPLFGKRSVYGRDIGKAKEPIVPMSTVNEYGTGTGVVFSKIEDIPAQPPPVAAPAAYSSYGFKEAAAADVPAPDFGYAAGYGLNVDGNSVPEGVTSYPSYPGTADTAVLSISATSFMSNPPPATDPVTIPVAEPESIKPPTEKEAPIPGTAPPGGLPDDLQHALDLIYAGNGGRPGPITFPPPGVPPPPAPVPVPPPAEDTDYDFSSNSYNYMDYQPYQHSFDGYGPADYSELDDGPPGIVEAPQQCHYNMSGPPPPHPHYEQRPPMNDPSRGVKRISAYDPHLAATEPPPPPKPAPLAPVPVVADTEEDDMDDLRMLGIDVEDAAAANFK